MADRLQIRRDTAANWTSANPILAQGEWGYELDENRLKIGDGILDWVNLPYFAGGGGGYVMKEMFNYSGSNIFTLSQTPSDVILADLKGQVTDGVSGLAWTLSGNDITVIYDLQVGDSIQVIYVVGSIGGSAVTTAQSTSIAQSVVSAQKDQEGGIAANDTSILSLDTVADLSTSSRINRTRAYVNGGGQGGSTFTYIPVGSGLVADGGVYFDASDGGLWKRDFRDSEIMASWFEVSSDDDTTNLMRAINAVNPLLGIKTIALDFGREYAIDLTGGLGNGGLILKSNTTLKLNGSTIKAIAGSLSAYSIISAVGIENVSIYGDGGKIIGEREDHVGTAGEHGMGIYCFDTKNIIIRDLEVRDCWGDGIYIGGSSTPSVDNVGCENVVIDNVISDNNRRQGLSVTCARNITVSGRFSNTNGVAPEAGIDLEPNEWQSVTNVTLIDVTCSGNEGSGIEGFNPAGGSNSARLGNIKIINATTLDNVGSGIAFSGSFPQVVSELSVDNLYSKDDGLSGLSVNSGVGNRFTNINIFDCLGTESIKWINQAKSSIEKGTINNSLVSHKGIDLQGINNDNTFQGLNIETDGQCIYSAGAVDNRDIKIVGNTLKSVDSSTLEVGKLQYSKIIGNTIIDSGIDAIKCDTYTNSIINDNYIDGAGVNGGGSGVGVRMLGVSTNNDILGNTFIKGTSPQVYAVLLASTTARNYFSKNNLFDGTTLLQILNQAPANENYVQNDRYNTFGSTTRRPSSPPLGWMYSNTTTGTLEVWNGSAYVVSNGLVKSQGASHTNGNGGSLTGTIVNGAIVSLTISTGTGYPGANGYVSTYNGSDYSRTYSIFKNTSAYGVYIQTYDALGVGTGWVPITPRSSTTGLRPTYSSSIIGVYHFDTTLGIPIWWTGTNWIDATGTIV